MASPELIELDEGAIDDDGAAIDDEGIIEDAADDAAEEALLAAGVADEPQAARVTARPAAATRDRARLINIRVLLG
jgi:hypothetical protein